MNSCIIVTFLHISEEFADEKVLEIRKFDTIALSCSVSLRKNSIVFISNAMIRGSERFFSTASSEKYVLVSSITNCMRIAIGIVSVSLSHWIKFD